MGWELLLLAVKASRVGDSRGVALTLRLPHLSAKGFQHQRMTNGAMNVEIGNPTYKMYEGEPDDDVGELLDADFALDPDKVRGCRLCRVLPKVGGAGGDTCWGGGHIAVAVRALRGGSEGQKRFWGWWVSEGLKGFRTGSSERLQRDHKAPRVCKILGARGNS